MYIIPYNNKKQYFFISCTVNYEEVTVIGAIIRKINKNNRWKYYIICIADKYWYNNTLAKSRY